MSAQGIWFWVVFRRGERRSPKGELGGGLPLSHDPEDSGEWERVWGKGAVAFSLCVLPRVRGVVLPPLLRLKGVGEGARG